MDAETSGPVVAGVAGAGPYLRRAQALLSARAELFPAVPGRLAGIAGPPQNRQEKPFRHASRQLTLPLSRERQRRQARMVR